MKAYKGAYILVFLGMTIILSSFVMGRGIVDVCKDTLSVYSMDRITVNAENSSPGTADASFSLKDMGTLKKTLRSEALMYSANVRYNAASGKKRYMADIYGVNSLYPEFYRLDMMRGSFFNQKDEDESSRVAVIDRKLAWELFGSFDVLGLEIGLFNKPFRVTGVFSKGDSMVHRISDDGTPDIYIPIQVFTALNHGTGITYAEAATDDTTTVGENGDRLDEALAAAGKNPYEYTVIDYNLKRELMEQKPSIIIFIMGLVVIFIFGRYAFRNVRSAFWVIRHGVRDDYFINVLNKNRLMLLKYILGVIFSVLAIILLWQLIRFEMYIPKKYIPEELTDLGYYFNLAKEGIQEDIRSLGYIPSPQEFMVGRADAVLTWSMYLGIIAGFLLFYTGMAQLKLSFKGTLEEAVSNAGILVLLCLIIVRITASAAGFPFTLRFADGVVWCIFIFLNAIMLEYTRTG